MPVEKAVHDAAVGAILMATALVPFGVYVYLQIFRRPVFLRFLDWGSKWERRLGVPENWIVSARRLYESRAHTVLWVVLVIAMAALFTFDLIMYGRYSTRLREQQSNHALPRTRF